MSRTGRAVRQDAADHGVGINFDRVFLLVDSLELRGLCQTADVVAVTLMFLITMSGGSQNVGGGLRLVTWPINFSDLGLVNSLCLCVLIVW